MANKRLLSLLFLISITNLFWTNAEALTCYDYRVLEGQSPKLYSYTETCPENRNYGCIKDVIEYNGRKLVKFGCADKIDCQRNGVKCCRSNNCNYFL